MARNAEVTRQWQVLRDIDAARIGITIPKLAAARDVHPAHHPARHRRARERRVPAVRREGQRHDDVEASGAAVSRARGDGAQRDGAVRFVFQPRDALQPCRCTLPGRRRAGVREDRTRTSPRLPAVPRQPARRHQGKVRGTQEDRRTQSGGNRQPRDRRAAATSPRRNALRLARLRAAPRTTSSNRCASRMRMAART